MGQIVLSNETVQFINLATKTTNAQIIDCLVEDDRVVFIVEKGQLGIALGRKAKNLERLNHLLKKMVKFVEYDADKKKFIENLCKPYAVRSVTFEGTDQENIAKVEVESKDKSKLIGKGGRNISMIRKLAQRHHTIKDVQIV
ncbi:MAG: NusA-like transcription termination signal-binding factor [Candidatus Thermoplasmatota archaeon]